MNNPKFEINKHYLASRLLNLSLKSREGASITVSRNFKVIEDFNGLPVYIVSYGIESKTKELTYEFILNYLLQIDLDFTQVVGTWYNHEDNNWYLDISETFVDRESAIREGLRNKQISIYDCRESKVIFLSSHKDNEEEEEEEEED